MSVKVIHYAGELVEAARKNIKIAPFTKRNKKLTLQDAYSIQGEIASKKEAKGKKLIGKKIGIIQHADSSCQSSNEIQYVGRLFNDMVMEKKHPIEIESRENMQIGIGIAFKLKEALDHTTITYLDVLMATDFVVPVLGIYESHWTDRDVSLIDVVAENGAVTNIMFGEDKSYLHEVNVQTTGLNVFKNDKLVIATAYSSSLGHPANAIATIAREMSHTDLTFQKGEYIVTSYTPTLIDVQRNDDVSIDFNTFGSITLSFI